MATDWGRRCKTAAEMPTITIGSASPGLSYIATILQSEEEPADGRPLPGDLKPDRVAADVLRHHPEATVRQHINDH